MGGGRDKKKKAKNAAAVIASKKNANKKASGGVRRSLQTKDDDEGGGVATNSSNNNINDGEDWDAILASYRTTSSQLTSSQLIPLAASDDDDDEEGGIFPNPPRGNFTWTYAPSNGLCYMFGGEYYNGVENVVFDELLCWTFPPHDNNNNNNNPNNNDNKSNTNKTGQWTRILTPPPHPPPRCAHSAVYYNSAIYIFGGENVTSNIYHHYRDLWKFDLTTNTWEELRSSSKGKGESSSSSSLPPSVRSGHRAIIHQQYMIIFGGFYESTKGESIQFYNDIHVYDIVNHKWKDIKFSKLARLPPPRSGCNLGLSLSSSSSSSSSSSLGNDNGNEDNIKVKEDVLVVYGGYSKVKNVVTTTNHQIEQHHQKGGGSSSSSASNMRKSSSSEGIVHVDTWILPLKYILTNVTSSSSSSSSSSSIPLSSSASWERIPRKGEYPSPRAGTTSIMLSSSQQSSMVVFGGVIDNEGDHHIMESIFYNDLFIFDMECKRWMAVQLTMIKDDQNKNEEKNKDENDITVVEVEEKRNEEVKSNGFGLTELRQDMFAFTDGEGNVVFENIDGIVLNKEEDDDEVEIDKDEALLLATKPPSTSSKITDTSTKTRRMKGKEGKKAKKVDLKKVLPKMRETPLPRINCASIIRDNTLYIYGGLVEVGDREVTLDDCWSIDLNKCDKKWNCIYPGRMHKQVWKGVDSDNDSYISSDQGADDDADSDYNDDDLVEFEPILEAEADVDDDEAEIKEEAEKRAKKEATKARDKEKRRVIRKEVAELKEQLDNDTEVRTNPFVCESVADFYARTIQYWDEVVTKSSTEVEQVKTTNKTKDVMRSEGFRLANVQYDEVNQIRQRLDMLERLQLEYDEKKAKKKSDKKLKIDKLR